MAKAAEESRIAAENNTALADAGGAEAERVKAAWAKQDAAAGLAADQNAAEAKAVGDLAALTPAGTVNPTAGNPAADIPRQLQSELRRVGCNPGAIDGNWDAASQKSLGLFNKNAHTRFDVKLASLEALEGVRGKTMRVCPLPCDAGFEAKGDSCIRIICKAGFELGDDKTCDRTRSRKQEKPVANAAPSAERTLAPVQSGDRMMPSHTALPGEPAAGTIPYGARVVVPSSACGKGRVLELIGGNNAQNIPRQKRCVAAN